MNECEYEKFKSTKKYDREYEKFESVNFKSQYS